MRRHAFPIGQQMHEYDVDILADLGRQQPGRPGLGGRDLDACRQRFPHALDVAVQLIGA